MFYPYRPKRDRKHRLHADVGGYVAVVLHERRAGRAVDHRALWQKGRAGERPEAHVLHADGHQLRVGVRTKIDAEYAAIYLNLESYCRIQCKFSAVYISV